MDNSGEKPASPTTERLHIELCRLEWAKLLNEDTLTAITDAADWTAFHAEEVVIEAESEITHVYFLITGRMQATLYDFLGKEMQQDTFARGAVIGLFSLGLSDRSYLHVQATEPSTAIRLTLSNLLQLTAKHADFQLAMFRLAASVFKRFVMVERSLPKPAVVGVVHHTEASRPLIGRLARRLRDLGESPCILGDDEQWKPDQDIPFKLLVGDVEERQDIIKEWAPHRRLLFDIRADHSEEVMKRFISYVDIVLWCVRPQDARAAVQLLQALVKSVPRWREKLRIVWLLDSNTSMPPYVPELYELVERDFKLSLDAPGANQGNLLQHGFDRQLKICT